MIGKCFYIAAGKLRQFVSKSPFVFVMFLLGSAACSLMFLYFWGNLQYTVRSAQAVSYTASLADQKQPLSAEVFALADTYDVRMDAIWFPDAETDASVLCTNRAESFSVWGCEWSDLEEHGTLIASDVALLPEETAGAFRVIGYTSSRHCFVSRHTFCSLGLPASELRLTLSPETSKDGQDAFLRAFAELTRGAYSLRETTRSMPLEDILGVLVPMLAVYLLCMLSMLYITVYILDGMVYELSVYGLLGATNKKLILIPAAVQGALLTAANGIAVLLHVLLYKPLFSRINLYEFTYTPSIYAGAILVMLALSLTVTFVYLKIRIGNYAVVNFRRNLR